MLTFLSLSGGEKVLFLEALSLQLWIGLLLKFIPFRRIPGLFANPSADISSHSSYKLEEIKAATSRAAKISPWKNKCLVSSLAARCMLRRRKIRSQLSIGVAKSENGRVIAHAWLSAGAFALIEEGGCYTELYSF